MCKIISVCNQKGGTGKSASAVNLGIGLARAGQRVLVLDNDPQGSLTASLGFDDPDSMEYTLATVMGKIINEEYIDPKEGILHHQEGIDLIPGNIELSGMDLKNMMFPDMPDDDPMIESMLPPMEGPDRKSVV